MSIGTLDAEPATEALFALWAQALASGEPARITALYASDAVLLSSMSNRVRRNPEAIADYFKGFMRDAPRCRLVESTVRAMGEVAIRAGIYRFTLTAREGAPELDARFTFVYQRIGGEWTIVAHHSSFMPEG